MILADRVKVVSLSKLRIITPRDTQMTSRLSLTNINSQGLLSADGAFIIIPAISTLLPPFDGDGSNPDLYIGALEVRCTPFPSSDLNI
jgi:hypothetical protein